MAVSFKVLAFVTAVYRADVKRTLRNGGWV